MKFTMKKRPSRQARPPCVAGFGDVEEGPAQPCSSAAAPRTAEECRAAGNTLAGAGRFGAALREFDDGVRVAPEDAVLRELRAQALLGLGRDYEAAAAADAALALAPDWADAHVTRARALLNYGELEAARDGFDRAIRLGPTEDVRGEAAAVATLVAERAALREEALRRAAAAANPEVAEVLRCKAALRCTAVDDAMDEG